MPRSSVHVGTSWISPLHSDGRVPRKSSSPMATAGDLTERAPDTQKRCKSRASIGTWRWACDPSAVDGNVVSHLAFSLIVSLQDRGNRCTFLISDARSAIGLCAVRPVKQHSRRGCPVGPPLRRAPNDATHQGWVTASCFALAQFQLLTVPALVFDDIHHLVCQFGDRRTSALPVCIETSPLQALRRALRWEPPPSRLSVERR